MRANGLRSRAAPLHSAPNGRWRGSLPSCHFWCGRDARVPGWVSPVALCVQTASDRGPTLPHSVPKTLPFSMPKTLPFSMPIDSSPAWRAKPAFPGFCSVVPLMVRAGGPRSRVGLARDLVRVNGLRSRAASSHGALNLPLRGSVPSCHLWCGRDARNTRERGRPARNLIPGNNLPSGANTLQSAPNLPLRGSDPSCYIWCGRDARVPGWVSPAA